MHPFSYFPTIELLAVCSYQPNAQAFGLPLMCCPPVGQSKMADPKEGGQTAYESNRVDNIFFEYYSCDCRLRNIQTLAATFTAAASCIFTTRFTVTAGWLSNLGGRQDNS